MVWREIVFQIVVIVFSTASILAVIALFYWFTKKRFKLPKELPFCPKCGSIDLHPLKKDVGESYFAGSLHSNQSYRCNECDYEGRCPLGSVDRIKEYKK